jgi:hypothetical protein
MVQSAILGFPRMGKIRDLKKATEAYWAGNISQQDLLAEGKRLRLDHWNIQKKAGVDVIPSNDFAYYDHVLDHIQMFNVSVEAFDIAIGTLLTLNFPRPFLHDTHRPGSTSMTHILLWAVDTRRTVSTFLAW